uniref:gamma-glutamyltransferase family protein n=1 Tax=Actinotalea sp. TaxID=1872145 RepID=UPI00356B44CA
MQDVTRQPTPTTRPEMLGTHGMVASTHWLASHAGMAVLEQGGNAFDAAVCAGLVLHVVEPHLNGLGGDVPILAKAAGADRPFVICGQGTAPAAATPEAFTSLGLDSIPGTGLLPAVVPGSFGAWMDLLARYGTWTVRAVLTPALGYARDGFPLLPQAAATIGRVAGLFREHWHSSAELYLRHGAPPSPGSRFTNPALATTLERLAAAADAHRDREAGIEAARAAFYEGFVAEAVDAMCTGPAVHDSSGRAHHGLLRGQDLADWRSSEEDAVSVDVFGRTIAKTGPWGQGPVLLQQLRVLEGLDLDDTSPDAAELIHAVTESAKLAFADRDAWYGDPDHSDVPLETLLSPAYADERRALIGPEARGGLHPGSPDGRTPRLPLQVTRGLEDGAPPAVAPPAGPGGGEPTFAPSTAGEPTFAPSTAGEPPTAPDGTVRGDTCHVDVVDRWGNTVSATPSGGWLQSSPTIASLGFALPTRAQMFWLEPGLPGTIGPGRRPRTTLSPTLVLRDGHAELACGTPGGDQQDQWQVPFLLRHLAFGMDLQEAIDAPSWHTTHLVSSFAPRVVERKALHVEETVGERTIAELRRRGHEVNVTGHATLGRLTAAGTRPDGMLRAAA